MPHEAVKDSEIVAPRPTLTIKSAEESTDLWLGDQTALFIDKLNLGSNISVILQRKPTAENPKVSNLLISGTSKQLEIFESIFGRASRVYQGYIAAGMRDIALTSAIEHFFILQQDRYPQEPA